MPRVIRPNIHVELYRLRAENKTLRAELETLREQSRQARAAIERGEFYQKELARLKIELRLAIAYVDRWHDEAVVFVTARYKNKHGSPSELFGPPTD